MSPLQLEYKKNEKYNQEKDFEVNKYQCHLLFITSDFIAENVGVVNL